MARSTWVSVVVGKREAVVQNVIGMPTTVLVDDVRRIDLADYVVAWRQPLLPSPALRASAL